MEAAPVVLVAVTATACSALSVLHQFCCCLTMPPCCLTVPLPSPSPRPLRAAPSPPSWPCTHAATASSPCPSSAASSRSWGGQHCPPWTSTTPRRPSPDRRRLGGRSCLGAWFVKAVFERESEDKQGVDWRNVCGCSSGTLREALADGNSSTVCLSASAWLCREGDTHHEAWTKISCGSGPCLQPVLGHALQSMTCSVTVRVSLLPEALICCSNTQPCVQR